jgi:hypothetical protein
MGKASTSRVFKVNHSVKQVRAVARVFIFSMEYTMKGFRSNESGSMRLSGCGSQFSGDYPSKVVSNSPQISLAWSGN